MRPTISRLAGWLLLADGLYQRAADNPTSLVHHPDPVSADEPPTACNRCSEFGRRRAATAAEALLAHLGERLARYKIPRHIAFVAALPISAAGKILRRELRKRQ
jgi:acyl-CoA synthetase (AMP-forming)/AMP-acid ligase II